ncbi:MAG: rhodanese-like domain-containing protein [Chloroflexota bacterium]
MNKKTLPITGMGLFIIVASLAILGSRSDQGAVATPVPTAVTAVAAVNNQPDVAALPQPGLIVPRDYQTQFVEANTEHFLLDVRTAEEFNQGHIPGAINISLQDIQAGIGLDQIPTDRPIVLYCRSGNRSNTAFRILQSVGFENMYDIAGGTNAWAQARLPFER